MSFASISFFLCTLLLPDKKGLLRQQTRLLYGAAAPAFSRMVLTGEVFFLKNTHIKKKKIHSPMLCKWFQQLWVKRNSHRVWFPWQLPRLQKSEQGNGGDRLLVRCPPTASTVHKGHPSPLLNENQLPSFTEMILERHCWATWMKTLESSGFPCPFSQFRKPTVKSLQGVIVLSLDHRVWETCWRWCGGASIEEHEIGMLRGWFWWVREVTQSPIKAHPTLSQE